MPELRFTLGLGIRVCHRGTVHELSLSPEKGGRRGEIFRPDKPGLAMTPLQLNGHVERAQRTHTEELYELMDTSFEIAELNQALLEWERVYNTVRPHQAAGYLTPKEFLKIRRQKKKKKRCQ